MGDYGGYQGPKSSCDNDCPRRGTALKHVHDACSHNPCRCQFCEAVLFHPAGCRHETDSNSNEAPLVTTPPTELALRPKLDPRWQALKKDVAYRACDEATRLVLLRDTVSPRVMQRLEFLRWLNQAAPEKFS